MEEKLKELYDEMTKLTADMQAFLDEHEDTDGKMSATDALTYNRMEKQLDKVKGQIDRREKINRANAFLKEPAPGSDSFYNKPILTNPQASALFGTPSPGVQGEEYRKNFVQALRTGFRHANNYLNVADPVQGGYLVPTEFDSQIVSKLEEENVMRKICRIITTASEHKITIVASKPAASWIGEGEQIDFAEERFGQVSLDAKKLAVAIRTSNELLADSYFDLEAHLSEEFGNAMARAEEESFLNGTGENNQPKGLLTFLGESATSFVVTSGANISADDLITLEFSLDRPYRRNASWLMSDATLALIRKFKDSTQNYIWQPSLTLEEPDRLLGYPIYTTPYMPPATAGNASILFGDFSKFVIGERGTRVFKPLREIFALSDQTAFLLIERVDCALVDRSAIRGLKIRA